MRRGNNYSGPRWAFSQRPRGRAESATTVLVVQARRNAESDEWADVDGIEAWQVRSANREAGWHKYRIVPREAGQ